MGPLSGVRIIEIAGIGPGPFAAVVLADMGAEVVRVDRAQAVGGGPSAPDQPDQPDKPDKPDKPNRDVLNRGRRSLGVDLKHPDGVETALRMVERADALVEGFRPGVAERLGIGPDACLERNPKLVYGRMTGWGQEGPYAQSAGHDINYIALAGALAHFGRVGDKPTPPINLVGDFGGGGLLLAFGVVCGLLEARGSGRGQVVDAAMVDGAALLMTMMWGLRAMGVWEEERGVNVLDSGAPFYDTYETADGRYISVGSLEPQFYAELLERTGLGGEGLPSQMDRSGWPILRERFTELFRSKTRDEWCEILERTDACFAPVLTMSECAEHPHVRARGTIVEDAHGTQQPAPAPRFSRTAPALGRPPAWPGQHTDEVLAEWGFDAEEVAKLREAGAVR